MREKGTFTAFIWERFTSAEQRLVAGNIVATVEPRVAAEVSIRPERL